MHFLQDIEEEGQWCDEKLIVCSATIMAKDLKAMTSLQQKHNAFEDEMVRRHNRFERGLLATGQDMIKIGHPLADQLMNRLKGVQGKLAMLKDLAAKRKATLEFATDAYLFILNCNETESFIKESIIKSKLKSLISAEALHLTADPARAKDMEELVPTEVRDREMSGIYLYDRNH